MRYPTACVFTEGEGVSRWTRKKCAARCSHSNRRRLGTGELLAPWSKGTGPQQPDRRSCATFPSDSPPEVVAAGHDLCRVRIAPENVDA